MMPAYRLVVVLSGRVEDRALIRYAIELPALHNGARRALGEQREQPTSDALAPVSVVTDEAEDMMVCAPESVEFVHVSPGQSIEPLLKLAAEDGTAALLVGESLGPRTLRMLVRQAPCSVWFVPNDAQADVRRILTPVDLTVRAADSLRVATALARLHGAAQCQALHVYFNESPLANPKADRDRAVQAYARFMKPIDTLDVPVTPLFQDCSLVARAINRTAAEQDADLIVLSSRGRTWAGAMLHESVAEQTLRECRVPLLVLKHFGARLGMLQILQEPGFQRRNDVRYN